MLAQVLIAFVAFIFVRDYMSDGYIKHAVANMFEQIANSGSESVNTKADPGVSIAENPPPALEAENNQKIVQVQESAPAIESETITPIETQAAVAPTAPVPKVEVQTPPEAVETAAAEPEPVPQATAPAVEPEPEPEAVVQATPPPAETEPTPQVEEQAVAVAPVPDLAPLKGAPEGEVIRDCATCPELVTVAPGKFMMAPGNDALAQQAHAGASHEVTIAEPFAIGRYEITFDEWDSCVSDGGCTTKPSDDGWGRGRRPVIHVSFNDITEQYLPWLSKITGHAYRLPTEAEWELASRGGANAGQRKALEVGGKAQSACNFGNSSDVAAKTSETIWGGVGCNDGFVNTAPAGSFKPNSLGIYDMHGNVWEWISDCWRAPYETEEELDPTTCKFHVLRGGSWASEFRFQPDGFWAANSVAYRAAVRGWETSIKARNSIGFRVARSQP